MARAHIRVVQKTDALSRHADALLALAEILELADRDHEAQAPLRSALTLYEQKENRVAAEHVRGRIALVARRDLAPYAPHALVAAARYLAAHAPTPRAANQTYRIAVRLNRGENVFAE